jgi:hypothetical protein
MSHYRIKIEEKNNGETWYIPQVGEDRLRLGRFIHLYIDWENIIPQHLTSAQKQYDCGLKEKFLTH